MNRKRVFELNIDDRVNVNIGLIIKYLIYDPYFYEKSPQ